MKDEAVRRRVEDMDLLVKCLLHKVDHLEKKIALLQADVKCGHQALLHSLEHDDPSNCYLREQLEGILLDM